MLVRQRMIILKTIKYSESDLIVHALNVRGARLNLIAKAALKSKKRFGGGVLEPTHFIEALYNHKGGDSDKLHLLQEAQLVNAFSGIRQDYDRLQTALYFLSLVEKVSQEGVDDSEELFRLLGHALKAAESATQVSLLRTQFEIKLLHLQGVLSPNPGMRPFLYGTFSEHGQIQIEGSELRRLQGQVHSYLQQYLG